MVSEEELNKYCFLLKSGNISVDDFRTWIVISDLDLKVDVTRGDYLKLKKGSVTQVLKVFSKIVSACDRCSSICNQEVFSSRSEFDNCLKVIEEAFSKGILNTINKPVWFNALDKNKFGAEKFYMCENCHSQWCIVFPEKDFNGQWERIS